MQKHVRVILIKNLYHQYFLKMGKKNQKNLKKLIKQMILGMVGSGPSILVHRVPPGGIPARHGSFGTS